MESDKGRVIALSGPHGTGKSTAVLALGARLKRELGRDIGIVQEVARRCPYPILGADTMATRTAQLWMFTEQIRCELDALRTYELVISDRSIIDYVAYSSVCGYHDLAAGQLALARHHIEVYKEIRFHGAQGFDYLKADGTRNLDPEMQAEVQARMLELYSHLGMHVKRVG